MAIAALLLGLFGWILVGLGSVAAVVLGIVSLRQINASGGWLKGRGLAIAGIVLGAVMGGLMLLGFIAGIINSFGH
jgi:hypothetical protein